MNRDLRALLDLLHGHWLRFGLAIAALGASIALGHLVPLLCGAMIDAVAGDTTPFIARPWVADVAIVIVTAASGIFAWLRGRWSAEASERAVTQLRDRLHDHLQRLPCRYLETADTGDLVQRCSSDVETVRLFLSTQVVEIGRAILMVLLAIPVMAWVDLRMTMVSLVLFQPIFAFSYVFFGNVKRRFLEADEAEAAMTSVLQENLTGVRVVRAFSREPHERGRFDGASARFRDLQLRVLELMGN